MNFWRFLVLLAQAYIRTTGMVTQIPNFTISRIPFEVPTDDIFSPADDYLKPKWKCICRENCSSSTHNLNLRYTYADSPRQIEEEGRPATYAALRIRMKPGQRGSSPSFTRVIIKLGRLKSPNIRLGCISYGLIFQDPWATGQGVKSYGGGFLYDP